MERYKFKHLYTAKVKNPQLDRIFNLGIYMLLIEHENYKAVMDALNEVNPVFCYDAKKLTVSIEEAEDFKDAYTYHLSPDVV